MKPPKKTNAARILDRAGVPCELRYYEVDESDLSGGTVARKIGLPPEQVFKTLVVRGDKTGVMMACVPVARELDLKALAQVSDNKKTELVPLKDVQKLTGYIRGGVSPVGAAKPYPVFLDRLSFEWPVISLSAGMRGCQMIIAPGDLGKVVMVTLCRIVKEHPDTASFGAFTV